MHSFSLRLLLSFVKTQEAFVRSGQETLIGRFSFSFFYSSRFFFLIYLSNFNLLFFLVLLSSDVFSLAFASSFLCLLFLQSYTCIDVRSSSLSRYFFLNSAVVALKFLYRKFLYCRENQKIFKSVNNHRLIRSISQHEY